MAHRSFWRGRRDYGAHVVIRDRRLFRYREWRGRGVDSDSQSDLHKSVHQFGIDCFAQTHRTDVDSIRSKSDKQFIWAKFPSGLIFPCWVLLPRSRGSAAVGCRLAVLVVLVAIYRSFRRYCCASRHSQINSFEFHVIWLTVRQFSFCPMRSS